MVQTKRKGGSKKRLLTFNSLTSSLNPSAKTFSPKNKKRLPALKALTSTLNPRAKTFSQKKNRLPIFKLLTSGLSPATRILLRKPKSRKSRNPKSRKCAIGNDSTAYHQYGQTT